MLSLRRQWPARIEWFMGDRRRLLLNSIDPGSNGHLTCSEKETKMNNKNAPEVSFRRELTGPKRFSSKSFDDAN
jgi:hypothetical protein